MTRAVLVVVLLATSVGTAHGAPLRRYAVLVAHHDGGEDTEELRYARRDARKVREVLTELGDVRPEDAVLLVSPSVAQVKAALADVEARLAGDRDAGGRAMLLFYYSGHAAAGELRLGQGRLSMQWLREFVRDSQADVRLTLLDACQSGAITRLKGGTPGPSFVVDAEPSRESRGFVFITSSSDDEASQESEELRGSFFTHYLVSGLRGAADASGDEVVTLSEAYGYAYNRTVAHTMGTRGGTQHPTYDFDLRGNDAVVLTRLSHASALLFPEAAEGAYVIYDVARDSIVGEVDKRAGVGARLSVAPGRYAVKKRADDHLLLQEVGIPAATTVVLDETAFQSVAFEDDVTKGPGWRQRAAAVRPGVAVHATVGYEAFFDGASRQSLFLPGPLAGVRVDGVNWVAPGVSLHLDVAAGHTSQTIEAGAYDERFGVDYLFVVGGVALTWGRSLMGLDLRAGPRMSAVYARREFDAGVVPFQDLFTFSPGVQLSVSRRMGAMELGVSGRVHYLRYATEAEDRSLGFGEGLVHLGVVP